MNILWKVASLITLGLVVIPCLLFFFGMIGLDAVKLLALIGTVGWFAVTPIWMGRELSVDAGEVEI